MLPDTLAPACLGLLAAWLLLSGLDDLLIIVLFLFRRRAAFRWPTARDLDRVPEKRIALAVPLWHEDGVIQRMLDHNLSAVRYRNWRIFAGTYRNDPATQQAVRAAQRRSSRVHLAVCPHDGPTSKADCINWIYRSIQAYESETGERFDVLVLHDAEDLIDPESLRLINYYSDEFDMVQVPVLPLPTPALEVTHSLYCDEFAEFQTKDLPMRQATGGFLPSCGVGTGFRRPMLERLEAEYGAIFEERCLTEDYETGFRAHSLGGRQLFLPLRQAPLTATREYFPRRLRAAVRQRTRWVTGSALQGWELHGWKVPWRQRYWFWRDRKGLVGNLLSPMANMVFLWAAADGPWTRLPRYSRIRRLLRSGRSRCRWLRRNSPSAPGVRRASTDGSSRWECRCGPCGAIG